MISLAPARFPKTARVRLPAQYRRVFEDARRVHHPAFTLHVAPPAETDAGAKLGLAVSRKVDPRAVGRNRIKRVLREATRRLRPQLAGGDYVVVARAAARGASNAQLVETWLKLLRRAGALPHPVAGGTMPAAIPPDPRILPPIPSPTPDA